MGGFNQGPGGSYLGRGTPNYNGGYGYNGGPGGMQRGAMNPTGTIDSTGPNPGAGAPVPFGGGGFDMGGPAVPRADGGPQTTPPAFSRWQTPGITGGAPNGGFGVNGGPGMSTGMPVQQGGTAGMFGGGIAGAPSIGGMQRGPINPNPNIGAPATNANAPYAFNPQPSQRPGFNPGQQQGTFQNRPAQRPPYATGGVRSPASGTVGAQTGGADDARFQPRRQPTPSI